MNKENRKLAQQRRLEERRHQEMKKQLKKVLIFLLLLLAIAALVLFILLQVASSSSDTSSGDTGSESTLSTDSSLTIADGDTVNIDYVGAIDGVEFDGGNTNGAGADLTIGSGTYIDDFEDQLIGAHPGDSLNVTVTFPDNYGNEELNGKEAVFAVTVNGIYKSE